MQIIEKNIFVYNKRYHASIKNAKINILNIISKYHDFRDLHFLYKNNRFIKL